MGINNLINIGVTIIFTLAFIIYGSVLYRIIKKMDFEKGKKSYYTMLCYVKFKKVNLFFPYIRLSLYEDFLVLKYSKEIVLKYNEVISTELIGYTLILRHSNKELPNDITIRYINTDKINEILKNKGVKVNGE